MSDTFNVSVGLDKGGYAPGAAMTLEASGTVNGAPTVVPVNVTAVVKASDGTTATYTGITANVITPGPSLTWALQSVSDAAGRSWAIAPDGQTATSVA